jgi:8-oxo-dGTP diphosphatase
MKTRNCAVAVIEKDGKILMGNKASGVGPYPNTWRIPGGGIEEGESPENAVKREVMEETGLRVDSVEKVGVYEDHEPDKNGEMTHYIFNVFKVEVSGKELVSEEFPELRWIDKSELLKSPLARPSIKLFKDLGYL